MGGKAVLVVEDNEMNMKLVRTLLGIGKYQVLEATDAETGIDLAQKHKPDLILMDLQLPAMDGLRATQLIKTNPDIQHIPVVALTSYAMQGDEEKARQAGCVGYMSKPIDTRNFLKVLSNYL